MLQCIPSFTEGDIFFTQYVIVRKEYCSMNFIQCLQIFGMLSTILKSVASSFTVFLTVKTSAKNPLAACDSSDRQVFS